MKIDSFVSSLKIHGVDADGIAGRLHNDNKFYMACLRKFFAHQSFEAPGQKISNRDYAAAFYIAHALKGASGNLGPNQFSKQPVSWQIICAQKVRRA